MTEEAILRKILSEIRELKQQVTELGNKRDRIPLLKFAKMMGVSPNTMRRRVDAGLYDTMRIGNRIYILYDQSHVLNPEDAE